MTLIDILVSPTALILGFLLVYSNWYLLFPFKGIDRDNYETKVNENF